MPVQRLSIMLVRQGFKFALRHKAQKEALLRRWAGCRRFVYNEALAHQHAEVAAGRPRPGYSALSARLPELKRLHPWLVEPPAQALQQALKDLCAAWDRKYTSRFGAPRFRKRGDGDTLRLPQSCSYDSVAGTVTLPKLGIVRLRHSRPAQGKLKSITLRYERGRWMASLLTEREVHAPCPPATTEVGLDFGVIVAMMPSAGTPIELPQRISRYERRVKRLQQSVSRKNRGSANRKKAIGRLADLHARIAAIRRDFLHQQTTELVRGHALIAIEDLDVKGMTASACGTRESPGFNVRGKAGLNRAMRRSAWSAARGMLEYKTMLAGAVVQAVPPQHTSTTCSSCGYRSSENRKKQAVFRCIACDHSEHADRNAAKNILTKARQMLAMANDIQPGGCSASTAGHAGTNACVGTLLLQRCPRPRSAAQGGTADVNRSKHPSLAGTIPELSLFGDLHPAALPSDAADVKCGTPPTVGARIASALAGSP
jgi:putative transposase